MITLIELDAVTVLKNGDRFFAHKSAKYVWTEVPTASTISLANTILKHFTTPIDRFQSEHYIVNHTTF